VTRAACCCGRQAAGTGGATSVRMPQSTDTALLTSKRQGCSGPVQRLLPPMQGSASACSNGMSARGGGTGGGVDARHSVLAVNNSRAEAARGVLAPSQRGFLWICTTIIGYVIKRVLWCAVIEESGTDFQRYNAGAGPGSTSLRSLRSPVVEKKIIILCLFHGIVCCISVTFQPRGGLFVLPVTVQRIPAFSAQHTFGRQLLTKCATCLRMLLMMQFPVMH
jgi:hypothetical protein